MGLLKAGEPFRVLPFDKRWLCSGLKSKDAVVGAGMNVADGSVEEVEAPFSVLGRAWTSLSQVVILISSLCSDPSMTRQCHQHFDQRERLHRGRAMHGANDAMEAQSIGSWVGGQAGR